MVLCLIVPMAIAQDDDPLEGPFGIGAPFFVGGGAILNLGFYTFDTGDTDLDTSLAVLAGFGSLNGGAVIDGGWRFSRALSAGVELGYLASLFNDGGNIVARGFGRAELGPLYLQPHVGAYILAPDIVDYFVVLGDPNADTSDVSAAVTNTYLDVGTKLGIIVGRAPFEITTYVEASYMIGAQSHLRVGLGGGTTIRGE